MQLMGWSRQVSRYSSSSHNHTHKQTHNMPRCHTRTRAMAVTIATWTWALSCLVCAHDDYLPLSQPEVFESPCVQKWNELSASIDATDTSTLRRDLSTETEASELVVHLTVQLARFESRYASFNTRTYNGRMPAPTIKVCPGDTLVVHVRNELGAGSANLTNLHVHGLHVSPTGHHDNVFVRIAPGGERRYEYAIRPDHPSGTFWYHPHSHGLVNSQLAGMMAGALIVVDRPGDVPKEIAEMKQHVLILQGVCVENCPVIFDSIVHALNNDYRVGSDDTMGMGMGMGMGMMSGHHHHHHHATRRASGAGREEEVFPIDLQVAKNSPLNDTSLLHVYVNGQYLPELQIKTGELKRLRYVNAIPNNVVELIAPGCELHVISRDGIYLTAPSQKEVVVLAPGSRADVGIRCNAAGTFFIETESSPTRKALLGMVNMHRAPSQKIVTLRVLGDESPASMSLPTSLPKPPAYMADTMHLGDTIQASNKYNYEFSMWMDQGGMKFGVNRKEFDHHFVNHSMVVDEPQEWELSARMYGHGCGDFHRDPDDVGRQRTAGQHRSNLDFSILNDGEQYQARHVRRQIMEGHTSHCHEMIHPFHMHGTHFQITRVGNTLDPDGLLFALGEWRDTILLFGADTQIRFTPRTHMVGHIMTHCHFAMHSDFGMAQLVEVRAL